MQYKINSIGKNLSGNIILNISPFISDNIFLDRGDIIAITKEQNEKAPQKKEQGDNN